MPALTSAQRTILDIACVNGRRASEQAVRAALSTLAITAERPPVHLSESARELRRGLRAKARQLGDTGDALDRLIAECAYEQWHRLLFARFLAANNLLIHPEYLAPVTLEDCEELAAALGEPDGWSVAARFAAEILPGIFRLDDPCIQLRLAPEGRLALERIVASLPADVFHGDDSLGWVYQYWQREQKDEVNRSERKIGGADIGPVTQLFTENYMVRFLLENSLGAWWAARHPDSPLLKDFAFLRVDDRCRPATGEFEHWPNSAAEVTIMDPCCGSGHFLVEAFSMLSRMRAAEEGLSVVDAQDAVLRENLFGLELDPRCVEIAMFAVAFQAWKTGGGWRKLPVPSIACSGIPIEAPIEAWRALAGGDQRLENALMRLHSLLRNADSLGSLINPAENISDGSQRSLDDVDWDDLIPSVELAVDAERTADPAASVLGAAAVGGLRALALLTADYVLVATNPPFLGRGAQSEVLRSFCLNRFPSAEAELANVMTERWTRASRTAAMVLPHGWLFMSTFKRLREHALVDREWRALARLGFGAFSAISGQVVQVVLWIATQQSPQSNHAYFELVAPAIANPAAKADALVANPLTWIQQSPQRANPDAVVVSGGALAGPFVSDIAEARAGLGTGDDPSFVRYFWELPSLGTDWEFLQSAPSTSSKVSGCEKVILWEQEKGRLARYAESVRHLNTATQGWRRGKPIWGRRGVIVKLMGDLHVAPYYGHRYDRSCAAIVPRSSSDLDTLWLYAVEGELEASVRSFHAKLSVETGTLLAAPIDVDYWRGAANGREDAFPSPSSDDPTQWLFSGRPEVSAEPLQVAAARLVGYRWPQQADSDDLDCFVDDDGIVCLPSVRGERPAADRLQEVLSHGFGGTWSPSRSQQLLMASGSRRTDLDSWLREDFFKAHCQLFRNRPFIWQVWDGRKDGFSALVNYHRLGRSTLEKLTYSYVGDWIERQVAGLRDDLSGAEERLAAARALQKKLELILEGESPYDIYVRWKSLGEQPIGWNPDLNDGVRLNVRPFVEAGVLRAKFAVKWDKDRGKNPDGSERPNDLHHSLSEKLAAQAGRS